MRRWSRNLCFESPQHYPYALSLSPPPISSFPSPTARCSIEAMNEVTAPEPSREAIIEALKLVEDPELFLDVWFLGLIYGITIEGSQVIIEMTFTSPMCPAGPQLKHDVKTKVGAVPGVSDVVVNITFQPAWQPSDEVKGLLGMM